MCDGCVCTTMSAVMIDDDDATCSWNGCAAPLLLGCFDATMLCAPADRIAPS